MYVRYFLWQFVGMDQNETDWSARQFLAIPFLFGLIGLIWQFKRDPKRALTVLSLFIMTGLAIIVYLNQSDPQPRERDYVFVGSFFAFSIWIGLSYQAILDWINKLVRNRKLIPYLSLFFFLFLLFVIPGQLLVKNYHTHDRSDNYLAWDYSYNILISCEPNAILFTHGDNDTYPLWYLQQVEKIRQDVSIVNLSLLNADWYIRQLNEVEPKVPMQLTGINLDRLSLMAWKKQKVTINVPSGIATEFQNEYLKHMNRSFIDKPDQISFEVKPTMQVPDNRGKSVGVIRPQDYMILNIIAANQWERPVYFSVTLPIYNIFPDLTRYLRMDGMVQKLVPYRDWSIAPDIIKANLNNVYHYRGLNDPDVYFDRVAIGMLQNYRLNFQHLAEYYAREKNDSAIKDTLDAMEEAIPETTIPFANRSLRLYNEGLEYIAGTKSLDSLLNRNTNQNDLLVMSEYLLRRIGRPESAVPILENIYAQNPSNPKTIGLLISAYQMNNNLDKAIEPLEEWLKLNPNDTNARNFLESIKRETSDKG